MYSLGSVNIDGVDYHFHGHSTNRNSPFSYEREHSGFITIKDSNNKHKVIGIADFYPHDSERNTFYANFPKVNKDHSGKGLMSELYKKMADHNKFTLISGKIHTKGGQSIWKQLSQMGRVTAHNTDKPDSKPILFDGSDAKQLRKFYTSTNSSNPLKWIFKYQGK